MWLLCVQIVAMSVTCILFMGLGTNKGNVNFQFSGPSFVKPEEGQGRFDAVIIDGTTLHRVKDFSFFGSASIGGVRKETDDSVRTLELSKIQKIVIVSSHYESKRFSDQEFMSADILSSSGYLMKDLLIPKRVIICGVDKNTLVEKAWNLAKVTKITIEPVDVVIDGVNVTPVQVNGNTESINVSDNQENVKVETNKIKSSQVEMNGQAHSLSDSVEKDAVCNDLTKKEYEHFERKVISDVNSVENAQNMNTNGEEQDRKKKSIMDALMAIVDACIDFFKAVIATVMSFFSK